MRWQEESRTGKISAAKMLIDMDLLAYPKETRDQEPLNQDLESNESQQFYSWPQKRLGRDELSGALNRLLALLKAVFSGEFRTGKALLDH